MYVKQAIKDFDSSKNAFICLKIPVLLKFKNA